MIFPVVVKHADLAGEFNWYISAFISSMIVSNYQHQWMIDKRLSTLSPTNQLRKIPGYKL